MMIEGGGEKKKVFSKQLTKHCSIQTVCSENCTIIVSFRHTGVVQREIFFTMLFDESSTIRLDLPCEEPPPHAPHHRR